MNRIYLRQALNRFIRVVDVPICKENKFGPHGRELIFQGFPYDGYNRAGYIDFWKAVKFGETDRIVSVKEMSSGVPQGSILVIGSTTNHLHPELHQLGTMSSPLRYRAEITEVGKTSVVVCSRIFCEKSCSLLVTSYKRLVAMNIKERMSAPLNQDFVDQCKEHIELKNSNEFEPYPKNLQPNFDDNVRLCHTYNMKVAVSETDLAFHTNQTSYLKYCLDAAYEAALLGQVRGITDDLAFYPCKESQSLYKKESFSGDELNIGVYQDKNCDEERKLYFKITKGANKDNAVCYHSMTFYDSTIEEEK